MRNIYPTSSLTPFLTSSISSPVRLTSLVAGVKKRRDTYFSKVQGLIEELGVATAEFVGLYKSLGDSCDGAEVQRGVGELVARAQTGLRELGVSHPAIEMVVQKCDALGLKAKLTGAGGGGCVMAILGTPEWGLADEERENVVRECGELEWDGKKMVAFRSMCGGEGMKCWEEGGGWWTKPSVLFAMGLLGAAVVTVGA